MEDVTETLLKIVELKTFISRRVSLSKSTKKDAVVARCIYANLLYMFTDLSEDGIAKKILRDRTSVYHMYKVHSNLMFTDKSYLNLFESCSNMYLSLVSTSKYLLMEPEIILKRLRKAELEIAELKEILTSKLSTKDNDELTSN